MTLMQGQPKRILVVDDEWMNRDLLESVLMSAGYEVLLANATAPARQLAVQQQPHLILLDVRVPTEREGLQLCRLIKSDPATAHIRVVMITALETREEREQAQAAGADAFISRMIDIDDLLQLLSDLLGA